MIDNSNLDQAWDPDPLQIGDRVRVRLSGECPVAHRLSDQPSVHGATGRVYSAYVRSDSHPYTVRLNPQRFGHALWAFARIVLERVQEGIG